MSDPTLPRTPQADAAFDAWWPRHAVRHNSRSPVAAREAFTAGWNAGQQRIREHILNRCRQLEPFADKATIAELRILAEELGATNA